MIFFHLSQSFQINMRICHIIEPDFKHIAIGLLTSHGLNQGLTRIDVLASKIIDFLDQLTLIVKRNSTIKN